MIVDECVFAEYLGWANADDHYRCKYHLKRMSGTGECEDCEQRLSLEEAKNYVTPVDQ